MMLAAMPADLGAAVPALNRWLWWLPRLAFVLFAMAVGALLWLSERNEAEEQRATLISDMLWLEQNLRFLLNHNEDLLGRVDPRRVDQPGMFDAHAQTLIASSTGMRSRPVPACRWCRRR